MAKLGVLQAIDIADPAADDEPIKAKAAARVKAPPVVSPAPETPAGEAVNSPAESSVKHTSAPGRTKPRLASEPIAKVKKVVTISIDTGHWQRVGEMVEHLKKEGFKTSRSEVLEVLIDGALPSKLSDLKSTVREHRTRFEG